MLFILILKTRQPRPREVRKSRAGPVPDLRASEPPLPPPPPPPGSGWATVAFWHHTWQIREQTQSRRLINCSYSRPWRPLSFLYLCVSPVSPAAPGVMQGLGQRRCQVKELPASPPRLPAPRPRRPGPTAVRAHEPSDQTASWAAVTSTSVCLLPCTQLRPGTEQACTGVRPPHHVPARAGPCEVQALVKFTREPTALLSLLSHTGRCPSKL